MLQGEVPGGGKNPIAGLHPFRLHRAYLAASRLPEPFLARLPAELLETEMQLKGETSEADTALADLVARVSTAGRSTATRPIGR
jgi:DNA polymerase III delta subunit